MNEVTSPAARRPIRWWPAILMILLALAALLAVWLREAADNQIRVIATLTTFLFLSGGLFLWAVLLSRLPGRLRLRIAGGGVLAVVLFFGLFRIEGFTGNLLPILKFRPLAGERLSAESTTAKVDIATSPDDFPQFRGATRDGRVPGVKLARDWLARPPKELWRRPIGTGWSGFAVVGQLAITQEQREGQDMVTAYELSTGAPVWSHAVDGFYDSSLGGEGPRATPTVADGQVFAFGPTGLLRAIELATGKLLWSRQAAEENGGVVPEWGYSGSPLLFGDKVVVSVGGKNNKSLVAYRRDTGEPVWAAGDDAASFSSPLIAEFDGEQQIVIFNKGSVAGHDPATGELLWSSRWSPAQPNVSQPIVLGNNRLLVSSGYGIGSSLFELQKKDGKWQTRGIWQNNKMKSKFGNPLEVGGKLYGLDDGIYACIDLETGERCWKEGRYGHGQQLLVGNLLLLLSEEGEMVMIDPDPTSLKELGRFPALSGRSWNTIAVSGSKLLVRNHQEAACFELPLE